MGVSEGEVSQASAGPYTVCNKFEVLLNAAEHHVGGHNRVECRTNACAGRALLPARCTTNGSAASAPIFRDVWLKASERAAAAAMGTIGPCAPDFCNVNQESVMCCKITPLECQSPDSPQPHVVSASSSSSTSTSN